METSSAQPTPLLEMAHVLFIDVVAYSKMTLNRQAQTIAELQGIIRATPQYRLADAAKRVVSLPTGDGVALAFFGDALAAVRCALELSAAIRAHSAPPVRMGVNTGPVYVVDDINGNRNVAGSGINLAQRIMDCGDAGHILVSESVAEVLKQLDDWHGSISPLGEAEVKHHVKVPIYNLVHCGEGNSTIPPRLLLKSAAHNDAASTSPRRRITAAVIQGVFVAAYLSVLTLLAPNMDLMLLSKTTATRGYVALFVLLALSVSGAWMFWAMASGNHSKLRLSSIYGFVFLLVVNLPATIVLTAASGAKYTAFAFVTLPIAVAALFYQRHLLA